MHATRMRQSLLALVILACAAGALVLYIGRPTAPRPIAAARIQKVATQNTHRILFVGASYTAGVGAQPPTNGYAYLAARAMGWDARVDAIPGTGYLNQGPPVGGQLKDNSFPTRLAHLPITPVPNILVLQGGRNDVGYPPAILQAAVQRTIGIVRQRFSKTRIVLLGPIPASLPPDRGELNVAHVLREAARSGGVDFIDPISEGWVTIENELGFRGNVPAHPDNAGYAYFAKRLVIDLDQLLGASPAPSVSADH